MSDARIERVRLGEVEVIRVVEWQGAYLPPAEMFPTAPARLWEEHAEWLVPTTGGGKRTGRCRVAVLGAAGRRADDRDRHGGRARP